MHIYLFSSVSMAGQARQVQNHIKNDNNNNHHNHLMLYNEEKRKREQERGRKIRRATFQSIKSLEVLLFIFILVCVCVRALCLQKFIGSFFFFWSCRDRHRCRRCCRRHFFFILFHIFNKLNFSR